MLRCRDQGTNRRVTIIDLEFGVAASGELPLGDIASSLVSVDELLRDLGSLAADPSSAEFRKVEIVAIETRNPLKIRLSLFAIPAAAVNAFQEICRDVIRYREQQDRRAEPAGALGHESVKPLANIEAALSICAGHDGYARITEQETQRLHGHIAALQRAEAPLMRVRVREA
jgi:hypothetical protein